MITRRILLAAPAALVRAQSAGGKQEGTIMAPVKLEIFSDFQCPGCKNLHETLLKRLRQDYVNRSKVLLYHREFPLPMHQYAREAACWACAAAKIGKYGPVSDALFHDQQKWEKTGDLAAAVKSVLSAAELEQVRKLAKDPGVIAGVDADIALGKKIAVSSTPTLIFTHKGTSTPITGVPSYENTSRFLNSLLGQ